MGCTVSGGVGKLSLREIDVMLLAARGLDDRQIAWHLGISSKTVKNHLIQVKRAIGYENRVQLVLYALKRGWLRCHELVVVHPWCK